MTLFFREYVTPDYIYKLQADVCNEIAAAETVKGIQEEGVVASGQNQKEYTTCSAFLLISEKSSILF